MPSIGDKGRPSRQRAAERSAAARAAAKLWQTNAPTAGSNSSTCERQRSRNSRGVLLPAAKFAAAEKNGIGCGNGIASLHNPGKIWETLSHIRRSAQTPAWSDGHSDGSSRLGRLKQTSLARVSMPSEIQM